MKIGLSRIVVATTALALVASLALAQDPTGKGKKHDPDNPSHTGGSSGGGSGPRVDPAPRHHHRDSGSSSGTIGSSSGGSFPIGGIYGGGGGADSDQHRGGNGSYGSRPGRSRSGTVHYGTDSNVFARTRYERPTIGRAPGRVDGHDFGREVVDRERVGLIYHGVRYGYYHYDRGWRDDNFAYPFYVFYPDAVVACVPSPWYTYACLPPYVDTARIIVGTPPIVYTDNGTEYDWHLPTDGDRSRDYTDLDYALDDIVRSFEDQDHRSMDRLVPRDGNVAVFMDGEYRYSLKADDFYDLFQDGTANVHTDRYEIVDVRTFGSDRVRVQARQQYTDPWGHDTVVYHTYYLERDGRDFVIRQFGVNSDR